MILDNLKTGSATMDALLSQTTQGIQGGQSLGTSLSGVASGLISPYASILNVVGLGGAFQKTFGNILANGFNISCWGSSHDPAKVKAQLTNFYTPYFNQLLSQLQNGDQVSINRFLNDVTIVHHNALAMQTATRWDKCSTQGVKLYLDFMTPLKSKCDEIILAFTKAGATKSTVKKSSNFSLTTYKTEGGENREVEVVQLNLNPIKTSPKVNVKGVKSQMIDVTKPLTKEPTFDGGELKEVVVKQNKSEGFPWWVLALGLGMM